MPVPIFGPADLPDALARELRQLLTSKSAIVCAGSDLRGDDGAGPAVAEGLAEGLGWPVHDARTAPESFVAKIAAAGPDVVVFVDATDFGGSAGEVSLIPADRIGGEAPGTHGPAPQVFFRALQAMHPCRCFVLGIQPACTDVGAALSEPVRQAVRQVVDAFRIAAGAD